MLQLTELAIIPKKILEDFYNTHVFREFKRDEKTCFVTETNNWTGIPNKAKIIQLLSKTLDREIITEGHDVVFPIPHPVFSEIKCKTFAYSQGKIILLGNTFYGDFHITIKRIDGGWKETLKTLRGLSFIESTISSHEIRKVFEKIPDRYKRIFVFIVNDTNNAYLNMPFTI